MLLSLKFRSSIRSVAYDTIIIAFLCTTCFYFSLVAINGNHGVKRKAELTFENLEKRKRLVALKQKAFEIRIWPKAEKRSVVERKKRTGAKSQRKTGAHGAP